MKNRYQIDTRCRNYLKKWGCYQIGFSKWVYKDNKLMDKILWIIIIYFMITETRNAPAQDIMQMKAL